MTTTTKDFKVKKGITVSEGGTFGGPVAVGTPTDPSHAITKEYLEQVLETFVPSSSIDAGDVAGVVSLDAGSPSTTEWETTLDGNSV